MASLTCNTVRLSPDVQTGRSHVVMEVRPGVGGVRPGVQQEVGQELQQLLRGYCLVDVIIRIVLLRPCEAFSIRA